MVSSSLRFLATLGAISFGGIFVYAGFTKVWALGPLQFADDIRSFHLLEDPWVAVLAMSLPWVEIICGAAVILGFLRQGGLLILNGSLLVFLVAISISWHRGIDISCGCFGKTDSHATHAELIWRDIALLLLGIVLMLLPRRAAPFGMADAASPGK